MTVEETNEYIYSRLYPLVEKVKEALEVKKEKCYTYTIEPEIIKNKEMFKLWRLTVEAFLGWVCNVSYDEDLYTYTFTLKERN
jgi:DNA polymerase III psi subunit